MSVRELTITLVGVKKKPSGSSSNNMSFNNELGWDDGENDDDFMEDNFDSPNQKGFQGPGPGNFRNRHYQNAYGNYRGGYGPQGEYGPPMGPPPELGFGPGPNFGPRPNFGPGPNFGPRSNFGPGPSFGMGPDFGPHPNFNWGRGFGPDGPPNQKQEQRALRLLARCGVPKENMKNLPRALLQLIEPTYCGLCATSLESFAVSRMHYVSKNHQKNQKKWLSNHSDMGGMGVHHRKELPVKSRELYCELCDVHITSKSHADSHYAGKPHRAIVEGRKIAKNPYLLQRGMENRLEMLIRREKKHLKAEDNSLKEEQPKPNKPISPELYCDICKTSVTCSEQMTMHLNGKRHLTKEKQHILKMMTGQADESTADADEDVNEEDEETGDNGGAKGDGQQDNYDWENGSGNWDEPAEKKE